MKTKPTDIEMIFEVMKGGGWFVAHAIRQAVGYRFDRWISTDTINARIRDLRNPKYGGFPVPKRRIPGKDHYEYSLGIQRSLLDAFPGCHLETLVSDSDVEATQ